MLPDPSCGCSPRGQSAAPAIAVSPPSSGAAARTHPRLTPQDGLPLAGGGSGVSVPLEAPEFSWEEQCGVTHTSPCEIGFAHQDCPEAPVSL